MTIQFEKVSYKQYLESIEDQKDSLKIYEGIQLPKRATKGSAGYDFYAPYTFVIEPGHTVKIPTGIRVKMDQNCVLMLFPRSSLGFKYRMQLNNTVGIIDSDYYEADNEGHIFAKITNDSNENKTLQIEQGQAFMQGVFVNYLLCDDDQTDTQRHGGIGSTDKKEK